MAETFLRRFAFPNSNVESNDSKRARIGGSQPQQEIVSTEQIDAGVSSLFNPSLFHLQPFVFPSTAPISQPQQSKLTSATHTICPSSTHVSAYCYSQSALPPPSGQSISSISLDPLPPSTLMPTASTFLTFTSPIESIPQTEAPDASDFDVHLPEASSPSSHAASRQSASTVESIDMAFVQVLPEFENGFAAHHRCPPLDVSHLT
jgi:hypothetical protein